ncbi:MAG: 2OG-Fe(II) oxygenase [Parvularculaceae bacterium]|nr:2OG-Fe(II) oxygenase [Parvularculaceae bacterium]
MAQCALNRVHDLPKPTREAMLARSPSVHQFWNHNKGLLETAWQEWEADHGDPSLTLDRTLYDNKMRTAVDAAWATPDSEAAVAEQWQEVLPGVYQAQLFDPAELHRLRTYLDKTAHADIPLRPPYGIALNRGGAMLDPRSEGYLAAPAFQRFYKDLMDRFMRPISRLLFPEVTGYDNQTFGFSIQWQPNKDTSLRPHTDASSTTLNINLNLPDEDYTGSAVSFFNRKTGEVTDYAFEPGVAVIHRGDVPHASKPITRGERSNLVLWLYGDQGQTPPPGFGGHDVDARTRWSTPLAKPDGFAPF